VAIGLTYLMTERFDACSGECLRMHEQGGDGEEEATEVVRPRYQVRLPGFVSDEDVGLGDVVKRFTSAVGIAPCGGCRQRAAVLNSWISFSRRH